MALAGDEGRFTYEKISEIRDFLVSKVNIIPKIGIICGSGLGPIADSLCDAVKIDYKEIPDFPVSTVQGHKGLLIFGYLSKVPVVCLTGRFHYYEGYPLSTCVMPVRLMKLLGVSHLIASNAAGGINPDYKVGDIMFIKDHINMLGFAGNNPLRGPNDERFGIRFVPVTDAYDPEILTGVKTLVSDIGMQETVREGVYSCVGGPCYETVAELRALKVMGADAVGMSTVHEIITARHCGIKCFAFSLITDIASTEYEANIQTDHSAVLNAAKAKEEDLKKLVEKVVEYINTLIEASCACPKKST